MASFVRCISEVCNAIGTALVRDMEYSIVLASFRILLVSRFLEDGPKSLFVRIMLIIIIIGIEAVW